MFTSRSLLFTDHQVFGKVYKYSDWEKRWGEGEIIKYINVPLSYFYMTEHTDFNGDVYYRYDLKHEHKEEVLGSSWMENGFSRTTKSKYQEHANKLKEELKRISDIKTIS